MIQLKKWSGKCIFLNTWGGRSVFNYIGSVKDGTQIYFGTGLYAPINISKETYEKLLLHFSGKEIDIGTSRTNPPVGSVGEWLEKNTNKTGIACYVGAILINEGYAVKIRRGIVRFVK